MIGRRDIWQDFRQIDGRISRNFELWLAILSCFEGKGTYIKVQLPVVLDSADVGTFLWFNKRFDEINELKWSFRLEDFR